MCSKCLNIPTLTFLKQRVKYDVKVTDNVFLYIFFDIFKPENVSLPITSRCSIDVVVDNADTFYAMVAHRKR